MTRAHHSRSPFDGAERDCAMLGRQLDAFGRDILTARRTAVSGFGVAGHRRPVANGSRHGEHLTLAGGVDVLIRPAEPGDEPALRSAFEQLGALSRFRGSLGTGAHLPASRLHDLTHVDHRSREALVAVDARTGAAVGVAEYVRDEDESRQADAGVLVVDLWQRRGVGGALLHRLAARAGECGHRRLTTTVTIGNVAGRRLLRTLPAAMSEQRVAGATRMTVALPLPPPD